MKIQEMPKVDRPREKLERYGAKRLTETELLAVILGTGRKGENVIALSRKIISHLHTVNNTDLRYSDFNIIDGLGRVKKGQIISALELGRRFCKQEETTLFTPKDVWNDLRELHKNKKECFVVYYLDIKNKVISKETVSVGTLSASLVHPREVFEPAVRHSSAHILLAHNHPSGDPSPSHEDISITKRLVEAGSILGIDVLDHVIVTGDGYVSMKEKNAI